eukprot:NODE_2074_length_1210_cov_513.509044_g1723_i0.p1 GENE.NODE_2074_length_1210_cov_513.509044_g1723_i0~~NODE_2074_length_1210_cov_513.509044_g1723_i0.p1  ORF type:complete len:198 (+),score=23.91 NODE_2074_length_1210_cov_513.509044_g1723_i0:517-1110(+)
MPSTIFVLGACFLPLIVFGQKDDNTVVLTCGPFEGRRKSTARDGPTGDSVTIQDYTTIVAADGKTCAAATPGTTKLNDGDVCEISCAGGTPLCGAAPDTATTITCTDALPDGKMECGNTAKTNLNEATLCPSAPAPEPEPETEVVAVAAITKGQLGCGSCEPINSDTCIACAQRQTGTRGALVASTGSWSSGRRFGR